MSATAGLRYGRWTLISWVETRGKNPRWLCRCDCGTEKIAHLPNLRSGKSKSCGCLHAEINSVLHATHRMSNHPMYRSWAGMRNRCTNENADDFKWYGARGISVCDSWATFEGFRNDMEPSWRSGLTLERVNVDGNYEPSNCRWATMHEQARNKTNSVFMDTPWGKMNFGDAAKAIGISPSTLRDRITSNWSNDRLFEGNTRRKVA